jgi:hypothetical protein
MLLLRMALVDPSRGVGDGVFASSVPVTFINPNCTGEGFKEVGAVEWEDSLEEDEAAMLDCLRVSSTLSSKSPGARTFRQSVAINHASYQLAV